MISGGIWPLVDAAAMRALDRHTIENLAVPGEVLMESAAREIVRVILTHERLHAEGVRVICGPGNNGGDGLVVARHLQLLGVEVRVSLIADPARLTPDAAANLDRARRVGVAIEGNEWQPGKAGVLIDALFGTGLSRPLVGPALDAVAAINRERELGRRVRVIAVDLPSGLDADTGQPLGVAVRADRTVTISLPKLGLVLEPGRSLAGEIHVARIGIADSAPDARIDAELWTPVAAAKMLPERAPDAHKGRFGHVLIVAGGEGLTGAAALAARASGRAGAGLVTLACPASLADILEVKCTEAMTIPVADTAGRVLASAAEDTLIGLARERDVVAIGPGVGRSHETVALMRALAKRVEQPLVIDADALFALADEPGALRHRSAATVLTPHPGEAAKLLGSDSAEINRDRVGAARTLAERTGAVVLLKGASTVAAAPEGRVIINPTGGPALGTGGTGDVLVGVVVALLAQGMPALEAAALGAWIHGAAAARACPGDAGLLAGDLADAIPVEIAAMKAGASRPGLLETGVGLAVPLFGT